MERHRTDIVRNTLGKLALRVKNCMTIRQIDFESALRMCYEPVEQEMKIAYSNSSFELSSLYTLEELFEKAVLDFPLSTTCDRLACSANRGEHISEELINSERDLNDISYLFKPSPRHVCPERHQRRLAL
ncbi:hypothetical protein HOLleu_43310 [Holothuria leucospilota]|uniref:Uncharacterized protein n=1 Tax=Holothuria leucospilota TaxID=206669 RepID=A0A9Q1BAU5_HOLLE|nr:hypothetical protein HOLleu_43310 [Holothuria leucospilota]